MRFIVSEFEGRTVVTTPILNPLAGITTEEEAEAFAMAHLPEGCINPKFVDVIPDRDRAKR